MERFEIYRNDRGFWVLVKAKLDAEVVDTELEKLIEGAPAYDYKVCKVTTELVRIVTAAKK